MDRRKTLCCREILLESIDRTDGVVVAVFAVAAVVSPYDGNQQEANVEDAVEDVAVVVDDVAVDVVAFVVVVGSSAMLAVVVPAVHLGSSKTAAFFCL